MQITIDPTRLSGLQTIVSRLNAAEGADPTTPEAYLADRVHDLLDSYNAQELERIKAENAAFFTLAASLPPTAQEQVKNLIEQLASA